MADASLRVRDLSKRFSAVDGEVIAVDRVSFDVAGGEFFTMVGASGCGKTTTLRMIAGLEPPTSGTITMGGRDFVATPAQQRNIGMVFQSYALFPHLTIFENVAYGLRLRGVSRADLERRVTATLALLKLDPYAQRHPAGLSGGQQQRVSIARALVYEPALLLLDEPLANLDAKLRVQMREELRALQRRLGITTIYVTHDQEEATAVSDRIAVFDRGRLIQVGAPETIYAAPATLYVADFIGRANFLPATLAAPGRPDEGVVLADGTRLVPRRHFALADDEASELSEADAAVAMLRPEHLSLAADAGDVACKVLRVEMLGGLVRYRVEAAISPRPIVVESTRPLPAIREGAAAWLSLPGDDAVAYHR